MYDITFLSMRDNCSTRRKYLKVAGGAISVGLAGCAGGDGGDGPSGEDESEEDILTQEFELKARNTFEVTPAVSGTTLFAPNADRNLYAIDVETEESLWIYEFNEAMEATPAAGENAVFTNKESDNMMYSFDPNSGEINWRINPEYTSYFNPPAYNGEYVFVTDDGVRAHNGDSGEEEWNYEFEGTLYTSSTVHLTSSNVVNTSEYGIFAVSQDDGSEQWTFEGSGEADPSTLATSSDRVIYGDGSNSIYIIDSQSGDTVHQISTSESTSEIKLVDNTIYYNDDGITAFDIDSMNELWNSDFWTPRLTNNTLYGYLFGAYSDLIVGIDTFSGEAVLNQSHNPPYDANPVIVGDYVVLANDSNSLAGYQVVSD